MECIRPYEPRDQRAVVALWNDVFGYSEPRNDPDTVLVDFLRYGRGALFVAEQDGALLGTVMAAYDGHRGWLYRLAVASRVRRAGIGSQLTAAAIAHLRGVGCKKVNLQLHAHNDGARQFWRAMGFAEEARISMGHDLTASAGNLQVAGC